jgi:hypothetical protein
MTAAISGQCQTKKRIRKNKEVNFRKLLWIAIECLRTDLIQNCEKKSFMSAHFLTRVVVTQRSDSSRPQGRSVKLRCIEQRCNIKHVQIFFSQLLIVIKGE